MKICILSTVNLKHMTLVSLYTDFFKKNHIKYDIIYGDKYGEDEHCDANNIYKFFLKFNRNTTKFKKILNFIKFRSYAKRIIEKNEYDYIIVWNSYTAYLFYDLLVNKYFKKYALNIRDYSQEKHPLVYFMMKKLVNSADFTSISSEGFKTFLPESNYISIHSINYGILNNLRPKSSLKNKDEQLNVCFIGYVRFFKNDKNFIDALGNDSRFNIQFFGTGSEVLEDYCKLKKINNVEFINSFRHEDTYKFLEKADIINNLYGNNDIALDTALSIKLYYSIFLNIPILVYSNTYMEKVTNKHNISYVFNGDYNNLADRIYTWYHEIKPDVFFSNCNSLLEEIENENKLFYETLVEKFLQE